MDNTVYKNKLVEGVDDKVWTAFTGYCKIKQVLSGRKITEILRAFLKKKNIKID
jgi:hypothetical protein